MCHRGARRAFRREWCEILDAMENVRETHAAVVRGVVEDVPRTNAGQIVAYSGTAMDANRRSCESAKKGFRCREALGGGDRICGTEICEPRDATAVVLPGVCNHKVHRIRRRDRAGNDPGSEKRLDGRRDKCRHENKSRLCMH
jgi:hypothetical protein